MRLLVNKCFEFIVHFWKKYPQLSLTILYLTGAVFIPENKTFFAWSILFVVSLFISTSSYFEALIYSFFPLILFNIGQLYQFIVVPPHAVIGMLYQEGRSLYFTLSPGYLLGVMMIVAVPILMLRMKKILYSPIFFIVILIQVCLGLFSAVGSQFFPSLSILFIIPEIGAICWGLIIVNYGRRFHKTKIIINILLSQMVLILLFHSGVVMLQTIRRSTLGLKIEQTEQVPFFGAGADENVYQFRPIGLRGDANTLANEFLVLLSGVFLLWVYLTEKKNLKIQQNWLFIASVTSFLVILITQCRSVYVGIFVGAIILGLAQRRRVFKLAVFMLSKIKPYKWTVILVCCVLAIMIGDRLWRSQFSFGESGGYTVRLQLIDEAAHLIQQNWWWGVGPIMFIPAAWQNNPVGVMSYFPESVHNGFYLFFAERGVFTFGVMMIGVYWLTRSVWKMKIGTFFKWVYASTLIAQGLAMVFQPFNNFITSFIILVAVLVEANKYE